MKITEENLKFLKDNLTPKDLIDLVALKSRMNNRKRKVKCINESFGSRDDSYVEGFVAFANNYLSDDEIAKFDGIFSKFLGNNSSTYFSNVVYEEFLRFLSNIDKKLISDSQ